ncbi:MAG: hypothetical protein OEQ29_09305 [Alphaproteobacteria bacterium]|nr:hypothetical protein [Alphaproteobacteria bacterium]
MATSKFHAAALTALLFVVAAPLAPDTARAADPVMVQNGVRYACTGIGEEKDDPRWSGFALKLAYAVQPDGALLSGVAARIRDGAGRVVLDVHCEDAPWLMAQLPPGRYSVTAIALGKFTEQARFAIRGGRQSYVVIRFPAAAGR